MLRYIIFLVGLILVVRGVPPNVPTLSDLGLTGRNVTLKNGGYLYMVEKGEGAPVIFIHGWPDSWKTWLTTIPYLSLRSDLRYIFVDLRGFGQSTRSFSNFVSFEEDIIQFMDALGIPKASLVGHSMGSMISRDVAIDYPSRVDKLILIASPLRAGPVGEYINDAVGILDLTEIDPAFVDEFQKSTFYNLAAAPEWFVQSVVYEATIASLDAWKKGIEYIIADNRPNSSFSTIQAKTLIMRGEFDSLFVEEEQQSLHQLIPNNQLIIVPNTGHSIQWDLPLSAAVLINNFLAKPCNASGSWSQKLISSWPENGQTVSLWELTFTVGASALYATDFSITPAPGTTIISVINAQQISGNTYRLPSWAAQNGVLLPHLVVNQVQYKTSGNSAARASVAFVNNLCLPPADCFASVSPALISSWNSSNVNYQQFILRVVNTGPRALANVEVEIKPSNGSTIHNTYNLSPVPGVANRYVCLTWNLSPQSSQAACGYTTTTGGSLSTSYATTTLKQPLCV